MVIYEKEKKINQSKIKIQVKMKKEKTIIIMNVIQTNKYEIKFKDIN